MFKATQNKGFCIKFENGIEVSIQFGNGNYCENRSKENNNVITSCVNAEVMAYDEDDNVILEPQGWKTPEEVLELLNDLSSRMSKKEKYLNEIWHKGYDQGENANDYKDIINPYNEEDEEHGSFASGVYSGWKDNN